MAGDWIKMRVDLGDDPAVVQMAARLDTTEDEVVGKLHRLWSWADRHTTDGTAPAITPKWVDRYVGCSGFAEAMTKAAWISFSDDGVVFPSFDRHNGESAKRRGEAAIRQRLSRKNRDEGVTGVPRSTIPRPFVRHVMERDGYACVYCGEQSSAAQEDSRKAVLSVDHIKPVTRGGSAAVENLACSCRKCNAEKNDRTPEEWDLLPTFLQPGVSYKDGQLVTTGSHGTRDRGVTREEERREDKETPPNPPQAGGDGGGEGQSPTKAGTICKAIRARGVPDVNPGNPELIALIGQGVTVETFEAAADTCVKSTPPKGMGYLLGIVKRQLSEAAAISSGPKATSGAIDPDSRQAIEAEGVAKGIGPWNEINEQWHLYKARVRGNPRNSGLDLNGLTAMAAQRQGVH